MNWKRSTKCSGGECVEVAFRDDGLVCVRDSQTPADILWFTREEWEAFTAGVKAGEFDR